MKYYYEKPKEYSQVFGKTYECDHPVYDRCTLYLISGKGLAVIQQRVNCKHTYWTEIDPWLVDYIYSKEGFLDYFDKYAAPATDDGLYPTVTVRQIMWGLKIKPIKRQVWETVFDKCPIS